MRAFRQPSLFLIIAAFLLGMFTVAQAQPEEDPRVLIIQLKAEKNRVRANEKFKLLFLAKNKSGRDILITHGKKPSFGYKPNSNKLGFHLFFFPNDHLAVFPETIEAKAGNEIEFTKTVSMNQWKTVKNGTWSIDSMVGYTYKEELERQSSTSKEELKRRTRYKRIDTETPERWIVGSDFKELQWYAFTNQVLVEVVD